MKRINGEDISTIAPTLGFNIKSMQYKRQSSPLPHPRHAPRGRAHEPRRRSYRLNIWDVGGQKTLRSYWRNYYEQTGARGGWRPRPACRQPRRVTSA